MNRKHALAAVALGGLFIAAGSTEYAWSLPIFRHSSAAAFTSATCLQDGVWAATLHISGTDLSKQPQATIVNPQAPLKVAVPYDHSFTTNGDTFTVSITVDWSDGFHQDLGSFTATRPTGCVPASTTTTEVTTSTTTAGSTVPPSTPLKTLPDTSVAATSVVQSTSPPPSGSSASVSPTTARLTLPTTGAGDWVLLIVAVGGFLVIAGIVLTSRGRAS